MASLMRVARIVSTSLKDTSKREMGRTSSLFVGCMMVPTPWVFSMHHTLNFLDQSGVFLFLIHSFTKGSRYCSWTAGGAWRSISAVRPDGPPDLFFPIRLRANLSSEGVTSLMLFRRAGSTPPTLMFLNILLNFRGILRHAALVASATYLGMGMRCL